MYNMGDKTYLKQPKFMTLETIETFSIKLREHILKHTITHIDIAFHGGEPLLWGCENIITAKEIISKSIQDLLDVLIFSVQTNGVLLTKETIENLNRAEISIGVSLDGLKENHDEYRVDHKGKGSFNDVIANFKSIRQFQGVLSIITVINLNINAKDYFSFLKRHNVTKLNLLLPDSTYENLPPSYLKMDDLTSCQYGKWLAVFFDLWVDQFESHPIRINLFETIIGLLAGRRFSNPMFGDGLNKIVVLETDGSLETTDNLRVTKEGITRNSLSVFKNSIDDILFEPSFAVHYFSKRQLCQTCLACEYVEVCTGGETVHRFSNENGFDNPSVYCLDMKYLIEHVNRFLHGKINNDETI
jgi:uncharacterized protein